MSNKSCNKISTCISSTSLSSLPCQLQLSSKSDTALQVVVHIYPRSIMHATDGRKPCRRFTYEPKWLHLHVHAVAGFGSFMLWIHTCSIGVCVTFSW